MAWKFIEFGEKTQNKGYYGVQGHLRSSRSIGTNRKPVCDFLLVIMTSYLVSFRSYCSLLLKFWTLCVFEPPYRGLRDNVRCSYWAHWKTRSGLSIRVNWTFFARCYGRVTTSEKRSKVGDFAPTRSVWSKILGRRGRPTNHFCTDSSRLSSSEVRF